MPLGPPNEVSMKDTAKVTSRNQPGLGNVRDRSDPDHPGQRPQGRVEDHVANVVEPELLLRGLVEDRHRAVDAPEPLRAARRAIARRRPATGAAPARPGSAACVRAMSPIGEQRQRDGPHGPEPDPGDPEQRRRLEVGRQCQERQHREPAGRRRAAGDRDAGAPRRSGWRPRTGPGSAARRSARTAPPRPRTARP